MSAPSERDVQGLARRIAEAGGEEKTSLFRGSWWSDQLLDWAMAKGEFKTQLFRFVDVFPGCRDDDDVMRHLQEYFEGGSTPAALRLGLGVGGKVPFGAGVSAATARRNIHRMARQFIAGQTAAEALPRLEELWRAGQASTVDLLGEKTLTSAEADRYADAKPKIGSFGVIGNGGKAVHPGRTYAAPFLNRKFFTSTKPNSSISVAGNSD